jgi:hypothetical protein
MQSKYEDTKKKISTYLYALKHLMEHLTLRLINYKERPCGK